MQQGLYMNRRGDRETEDLPPSTDDAMIGRQDGSARDHKKRSGAQALPGEDFQLQLLRGYSRTVSELEWLVLLVAALYVLIARRQALQMNVLVVTGLFWALFGAFHYANFFRAPKAWKIAAETWLMIGFITWLVYLTGGVASPLTNLYFIVVVISAVTLGHRVTILEVLAIGACLLYVHATRYGGLGWGRDTTIPLITALTPLLLVGLLASLLGSTLRATHRQMQRSAETDPLTGLFNRRLLLIVAQHEYARALRFNEALSVLMIDVDGLKAVNDTYGHAIGDRLLHSLGTTLSGHLRQSDTVGRYGGDEFVVLLPSTDKAGAIIFAQRVRRELTAIRVEAGSHKVSVSVSIGVATFPADGATLTDLLEAADLAMYRHRSIARDPASPDIAVLTPRTRLQSGSGDDEAGAADSAQQDDH